MAKNFLQENLNGDTFRQEVASYVPCIKSTPQNADEQATQLRAIYRIGELLNERLPGRSPYGENLYEDLASVFERKQGWLVKVKRFAKVYSETQLDALCDCAEYIRFSHVQHLLSVKDKGLRARLQRKIAGERWSLQRLQNEIRQVNKPARGGGRRPTSVADPRSFLLDLIDRSLRWKHLEDRSEPVIEQLTSGDANLLELLERAIEEVVDLKKRCNDLEITLKSRRRTIKRRI